MGAMRNVTRIEDEAIKACRHVEQYRGKRLRPILVLLSGLTTGGDKALSGG